MISVFTSESVTCGHPDKICDQIADAVLDDILSHDEKAYVSCEVTACRGSVHIMGEITAAYTPDYDTIARSVISSAGYGRPDLGFDARNCYVHVDVHPQSSDFSRIINCRHEEDMGAGSQCVVSGYACDETPEEMPLPITLANRLSKELQRVRQEQIIPYLLPDGTAQVCVAYQNGKPFRLSTIVISAQHRADAGTDTLREAIDRCVVRPSMPSDMIDAKTDIYINPTGSFVTGGPAGCSGMTGRKVISDTYGGVVRYGGGTLSGKGPTTADRTGAYLARYLAKNIVASGIASRCEVRLSYAIGLADPTSLTVDTFGTGKICDEIIADWLLQNIDMRIGVIIQRFCLRRPIYSHLSCGGHFGLNAKDMPWEQADIAQELTNSLH